MEQPSEPLPILPQFKDQAAIIIGTGPSLSGVAQEVRDSGCRLFGINNTYQDFDLDVWIACDPAWHDHYGRVEGDFHKWHWDEGICQRNGYNYIPGRWEDGLSTDPNWISYGHSSGWQALNLAVHYGCNPILLVGFDMNYPQGLPRHYFSDLSGARGEYPEPLRKHSLFAKPDGTGLLYDYRHIAEQCERGELPEIINCTIGSAMKWFPIRPLSEFV